VVLNQNDCTEEDEVRRVEEEYSIEEHVESCDGRYEEEEKHVRSIPLVSCSWSKRC